MLKKLFFIIFIISQAHAIHATQTKDYKVKENEYLYKIARDNDINVSEIKKLNPSIDFNKSLKKNTIIKLPIRNSSNKQEVKKIEKMTKDKKSIDNNDSSKIEYHIVQNGENVFRISKLYNMKLDAFVKLNNIQNNQIKVGQKVKVISSGNKVSSDKLEIDSKILDTTKEQETKVKDNTNSEDKANADRVNLLAENNNAVEDIKKKNEDVAGIFSWPVDSREVLVQFGKNFFGHKSEGIAIAAEENAPIKATATGRVVYSDNSIKEFGNVIIIKHFNGFMSIYGHLKEPIVQIGERVKKDQVIAYISKTGNAKTPQLYFSIRKNNKSYDPMSFLDKK